MPIGYHTILFSLEGRLLAFGGNSSGQLGLGHRKQRITPAQVPWKGPQPVEVECGLLHSLVLDAEGGVWQAGDTDYHKGSLTFERVPENRGKRHLFFWQHGLE